VVQYVSHRTEHEYAITIRLNLMITCIAQEAVTFPR